MQDRDQAIALWRAHNDDDSLFRHALAVEASMRHFAGLAGLGPGETDWWGLVGLLHDIDYQRHPTEHLRHTEAILAPAGYPPEFIRAVNSHGWGLCTDVEPVHPMEKALFAVDELTGLVAACAYVRPSKSVLDLEVKSVRKKWGTAAFAAGANRAVIEQGAGLMGITVDELIAQTILALRGAAAEIGLKGNL